MARPQRLFYTLYIPGGKKGLFSGKKGFLLVKKIDEGSNGTVYYQVFLCVDSIFYPLSLVVLL